MKTSKIFTGIFLPIIIFFSACSKDEAPIIAGEDQAYLSFNTILNDVANQRQMNPGYPVCPEGVPAYVEIILRFGDIYVAGTEMTPHRIDILESSKDNNNDGINDYLTDTSAALGLIPGNYTLEYFTVLDASENVLWIAPINDKAPGGVDDIVSKALPMKINLRAREKKFQDVEVICFDDRNINEYGYRFYQLNGIQVIEFCIFGNYCDESGRHAEFILFEVDVWKYSGNALAPKGLPLHEDLQNEVIVIDYEDYSETQSFPLCLTLPDGPGLNEYYIEITQINLGAENVLVRSGLISDIDVKDLFRDNLTMDYFHFTEGECNIEDEPVLINDPRDILGTWEFTFVFGGDALLAAGVIFYPDGTASYSEYWTSEPLWGTWAYFDNILYYDPDGEEDIHGYYDMSGSYNEGRLTGTFWQGGFPGEWEAERKD